VIDKLQKHKRTY